MTTERAAELQVALNWHACYTAGDTSGIARNDCPLAPLTGTRLLGLIVAAQKACGHLEGGVFATSVYEDLTAVRATLAAVMGEGAE